MLMKIKLLKNTCLRHRIIFGLGNHLHIEEIQHLHRIIDLIHIVVNLDLPFRFISEDISPKNTKGGGTDNPPCHEGVKRPEV